VNAGIIGFGPDQSLIRFKKEADRYKPDLVIFHIFADNDFGDILRNRLFELDANHGLIEINRRRKDDDPLVDMKPPNFVSSLLIVQATKSLPRNIRSFLGYEKDDRVNLLQEFVKGEFSAYKESQRGKYSHFIDHYDLDLALDPDKESSKTKKELMEAILKTANNVARSKGIEFLVVIQPSVIDLTKGNAVLDYEYLEKYPKYRRTNLSDAVKNICVANNLNCINFYEAFMRNDPENLFFSGNDDHWNDRGQDIAARETASYITNRAMLKKE
jgi:succinate dehydrogenase flavin-adding protein (antitoxin of CptAB toxin-antitoxin module)